MTSEARNSQIPSLPLASPESGRSSTVYGMFMSIGLCLLRFEGRREVARRARDTVFVRSAIDDRLGQEVAVSRRRRRRPLQRGRLPRVDADRLAPFDAHEEVDDE